MTTRTATAELEGDGLRLIATTGSGHRVVMDDAAGDAGPRPAELLIVAQAGCAAMDVVSMLRKQRQPMTHYEARVSGEQRHGANPHVFRYISIVHVIEGDVDIDAVRRAIALSATRYCVVTGNLASGVAKVRHGYLVRDTLGNELAGEVVITGPRMDVWDRHRGVQGYGPSGRPRAVIQVIPEHSLLAHVPRDPREPDRLVIYRQHDKMPELLLELI